MKKSSNSYTLKREIKVYIDEKHITEKTEIGKIDIDYKLMSFDTTPEFYVISVESGKEISRILVDKDEEKAKKLFCLMFENSVTPTNASEVAADFLCECNV